MSEMAAATQAEIREAIENQMARDATDGSPNPAYVDEHSSSFLNLGSLIQGAAGPLVDSAAATLEGNAWVWEPVREPGPFAIWYDLRPSEALELREAIAAAVTRVQLQCSRLIIRELVAVGVEFAAAHPDLPRVTEAAL